MSWWRRFTEGVQWDGRVGPPRSANGASSFHLAWEAPTGSWTGAEAVLEVIDPPAVPSLYFWALQVSFEDRGRAAGGAHFGLQWYSAHPGSTAVNWGGYAPDGRELSGTESLLPERDRELEHPGLRLASAHALPPLGHTRGLPRSTIVGPGGPSHRPAVRRAHLRSRPDQRRVLVGGTDGVVRGVRRLRRAARRRAMESACSGRFRRRQSQAVDGVRVNYQAIGDGGCARTNSSVVGDAFEQRTGTERTTPQGSRLQVSRS